MVSSIEKTPSGTVISGFEYAFDAAGRLSYEKNVAKQIKVCYTYDVLSRVIQRKTIKLSDNSEVVETYSYNSAGNLCTACGNESFRYDGSNKLTSFNGKPVTYDADGNMLEASVGKFTYDSANRLITADTRYYAYDVEGTRVSTQRGEDVTKFTYNVNARLSQLLVKTENNAETKYVYGLGLIGEEVSGSFKVYHFDYRGSTVAITDSSCNITDTFTYDTYGKLTARTGTTKTPFLYNGRDGVMYEEDTGLIYMRARYYSPELRRFINADKVHGDISNALSLNRYAFCNGNPAVNVDPMGLSAERGGVGNTVSKTNYLPPTMLYIKPIPIDVIDALMNKQIENNKKVKHNSNSLSKLYQFLYKSSNFISSFFVGYSYNSDEVKSRFISNSNLQVETNPDIIKGIYNNQHTQLLRKYAFGNSTISDAGCEAIAVYNSLYNLGLNDVKLSEIIYNMELENAMLNGGKWGCNPYSLERVMNKYNVNMSEVDFEEANQKGDYIFSYITDDTAGKLFRSVHTVAAHYDGNNYTVYNNLSGKSIGEEHYKSLNEFANNYICGFYLNGGE